MTSDFVPRGSERALDTLRPPDAMVQRESTNIRREGREGKEAGGASFHGHLASERIQQQKTWLARSLYRFQFCEKKKKEGNAFMPGSLLFGITSSISIFVTAPSFLNPVYGHLHFSMLYAKTGEDSIL